MDRRENLAPRPSIITRSLCTHTKRALDSYKRALYSAKKKNGSQKKPSTALLHKYQVPIFMCQMSPVFYQHTATHCNTLQHTSTHCNTPQHTSTHCNTLQYTAIHCNTLQHTATLFHVPKEPCILQPVPWKMRLEMLNSMIIEILNGGEILVHCKFKLNKNLNLNWYR